MILRVKGEAANCHFLFQIQYRGRLAVIEFFQLTRRVTHELRNCVTLYFCTKTGKTKNN